MTQRGQAVPSAASNRDASIISIILPGLLDVTSTDIANWYRVPDDFTLDGATVHATCKVSPGSSIVIMLQRSINNGSSWSSILSSGLSITGHVTDIAEPPWNITTLSKGNLLRVQLTTADSACSGTFIQIIEE